MGLRDKETNGLSIAPFSPPCPHFCPAAAAAVVLALGLFLAGCARKAPEAPPTVYPYSSTAPHIFYATETGLVDEAPAAKGGVAPSGARPASQAPNASVLSSNGRVILAAINGWGIARIECAPARADYYRVVGTPQPELFSGLSTGGAWPLKGGTLVQLYRDPFTESGTAKVAPARLVFLDGGGLAKALDPFGAMAGPGYELFALLPSGSSWFAELRKDQPERVDLKFLALGDPLVAQAAAVSPSAGAATIREIRKPDFEAALKPRPLDSLSGDSGKALRAALAVLGKREWLVRLRSDTGEDDWYLSSGKAEDALPVYAWTDGKTVMALRSDGWIGSGDAQGASSLSRIELPREDASFVALAAAGELVASGNLVAAAWEAGIFPNLDAAGLVVEHIARPVKRDTMKE
jgi:hypothetical protein